MGFSDPAWGSVQAGRTPNFSLEQVVEYDPLQAALLYSPLGYSGGIGGGLGATENTRLDNSIKYEYKLSGINVGLQYKLAGDKNSQAAGHGWVGMLGYEAGAVSVKGTYSQTTNSVAWPVQYSNVVKPGASLQIEDTKGYMLAGMYKLAAATVKVGYEYLQILPPSNPNLTSIQNYFGINVPKPAVNATGEQRYEVFWVGGDYKFTPEFDLGLGFYDIGTYNEPEIGKAYWAQAYSLLADYTFTKKFDAYIGVMVMQYSGVGLANKAPVIAYSNNGIYGVGLRYKF